MKSISLNLLAAGAMLFALLALASEANAAPGDELARQSLATVRDFYVIVETTSPLAARIGLDQEKLQTAIELSLRRAGINPIPRDRAKGRGLPYLYVNVNVLGVQGIPHVVYGVRMSFYQPAVLLADPTVTVLAETWGSGSIGYAGLSRTADIGTAIFGHLDIFTNLFLSVNPRER